MSYPYGGGLAALGPKLVASQLWTLSIALPQPRIYCDSFMSELILFANFGHLNHGEIPNFQRKKRLQTIGF